MRRTKMGAAESAGSAIQRELPTGDEYNAHQHGRSVGTRSIWNERNGSPPYMSRQADKFKSILVIILPNEFQMRNDPQKSSVYWYFAATVFLDGRARSW